MFNNKKLTTMSISDLFDSGFKIRNKGHFSALVRVAYTGGISPEEKAFLDKIAVRLDITKEEYEEILQDPMKYEINAPYLYIERLERLYNLARMVHHDHHLGDKQDILLRKIGLALGFTPGNVNYIVNKALILVDKKVDDETFIYEMQNMN